jgi:hypothetical protein
MKAQDYLPLTETSFFILLSLATQSNMAMHITEETISVMLSLLGTYSALRRMLESINRVRKTILPIKSQQA